MFSPSFYIFSSETKRIAITFPSSALFNTLPIILFQLLNGPPLPGLLRNPSSLLPLIFQVFLARSLFCQGLLWRSLPPLVCAVLLPSSLIHPAWTLLISTSRDLSPERPPPSNLVLAAAFFFLLSLFFFFAESLVVYPAGGCDVRDAQQQKITTSPSATCWPPARLIYLFVPGGRGEGSGCQRSSVRGMAARTPGALEALGCARRAGGPSRRPGNGLGSAPSQTLPAPPSPPALAGLREASPERRNLLLFIVWRLHAVLAVALPSPGSACVRECVCASECVRGGARAGGSGRARGKARKHLSLHRETICSGTRKFARGRERAASERTRGSGSGAGDHGTAGASSAGVKAALPLLPRTPRFLKPYGETLTLPSLLQRVSNTVLPKRHSSLGRVERCFTTVQQYHVTRVEDKFCNCIYWIKG
ncbi:eukaryotic translation initiation factor 4E type 3 isoform X2 [Pteropus medius]|uniref:eukaryotic translation initiation factor 4E type 3 isoform X2 n=1 Tax=Pteropus vampyrus TaxID=132908 RepID=UPI00196A2A9F|nr:eukaryotic translation initiation factor 4E type 3 isoform X2 [Pteropus giganteus]